MISQAAQPSRFVLANWGATGRGEATLGSDVDVLCWAPHATALERHHIEAAVADVVPRGGTYLDLLLFDGSKPLEDWARATATDYQAVLFAVDIRGPNDLVRQFVAEQRRLWADERTRAREIWMLVSETLLHPRTMEQSMSMFRPEKYLVGATRSFVTVAETFAMINGWTGRLTTSKGLAATERALGRRVGQMTEAYEHSLHVRRKIEAGGDPDRYADDYQSLGALVSEALADLLDGCMSWIQESAGVPLELLVRHFRLLFGRRPNVSVPPRKVDQQTCLMLQAFGASDYVAACAVRNREADWFVRYAATANVRASSTTLDLVAYPQTSVDSWSHRNIWLWVMRHPNVGRETVERLLAEDDHRAMDYAAAKAAVDRLDSKCGSEVDY